MEQSLITYLEGIGITGPLIAKVEEAHKFYNEYLGYDIDDIFVTEFINKEGSRVHENLWFFNQKFCYEAKLFNSQEDYDCDVIKNNINSFTIKKTEFNIVSNETTENSRMVLEFSFKDSDRSGEMKASKENCKHLAIILKKYIQPNIGTEITRPT